MITSSKGENISRSYSSLILILFAHVQNVKVTFDLSLISPTKFD